MCGLAGFVNLRGAPADGALLHQMLELIGHRGPDERGIEVSGPCGLGHVRLSIVDLAAGQQPMSTEDGRYHIVFNGEIFNHVALREEMVSRGCRFRTHCDTEVILQLFAQKGEACVHELNGQWAFAIWDALSRKLFMSRDRIGIRPLYYMRTAGQFLFGSEIKTLLAHPSASRRLDLRGIDDVLTMWTTLPSRTVFADVAQLPPGHSLTLAAGEIAISQYWRLDFGGEEKVERPEEQYAEELRALLVDATRLQFSSADVPVGAYLSGGLDSTLVTSVARRFASAPLHTFSVGFEDAEFDESSYQKEAAQYLGVRHEQVLCRKQDIADVFPDAVWHAEQPLVRTAPAPMFLLARLVRQHGFKVVLTGEGADELFGGYDIFKEAKVRRLWAERPHSRTRPLLLRKLYPYIPGIQKQSDDYLRAFFHAGPEDLRHPFFSHLPRWELTRKVRRLYSDDAQDALGDYDTERALGEDLPAEFSSWSPFCQAQFLETTHLLPGYLLSSQGDRATMAHGVEGRYPFLDHRLVEFASRLPARLKMSVLDEKYLLKKMARDFVPAATRKRSKQPYRAPEALSFYDPGQGRARAEYVDDLLSPAKLRDGGIWDPAAVGLLVDKARRGKVVGVGDGMALVSVLSTQLLNEQFIERFGRVHHVTGN